MKKLALRVLGPYEEPHGFRLVVLDGAARKALKYKTLPEAEHAKSQLHSELTKQGGRSVGEALTEYERAMVRERGRLASSAAHGCRRLSRFLPTGDPLTSLTVERAEALYRAEAERLRPDGRPLSVATHHVVLQLTKSFFDWCVEKGYLAKSPFTKVRKLGRPKSGKLQLTASEARRFLDAAMLQVGAGDVGALAVALQLSLGLRSSEVLSRRVRDVDADGAVLMISSGKTDNARRRPQVPYFLRPQLLSLIANRAPDALLFGDHGGDNSRCTFLRRKVAALCHKAGVPIVCPHSLRGLHATLALRQGVSSHEVAAALGHGSFAITARHYADPSAIIDARVRSFLSTLSGDASAGSSEPLSRLAQSLRTSLSGADIDTLIELLRKPALV